MRILIMGLPGSGKTWLAERLQKKLNCAWYNADVLRRCANDWDFSDTGRIRQAWRMKCLSDIESSFNKDVICDFVAPTQLIRDILKPDKIIWMNTIDKGRFEDTNKVFEKPESCDIIIDKFLTDQEIENLII